MQIIPQPIPAVKLLRPKRFGDHRGYFAETYSLAKLIEQGIDLTFVQDNESLSAEKGTVRGLHFQSPPHAQEGQIDSLRARGATRCGGGYPQGFADVRPARHRDP